MHHNLVLKRASPSKIWLARLSTALHHDLVLKRASPFKIWLSRLSTVLIRIQLLMTWRFSNPFQRHLDLPPPPSLLVALTPVCLVLGESFRLWVMLINFHFASALEEEEEEEEEKRSIVSVPVESRSTNKRQWQQWASSANLLVCLPEEVRVCMHVCTCAVQV